MRFTDGTGGFLSLPFAVSGERSVDFERSLFRAPFGGVWFTSGDAGARPLSLDVSISLPEVPPVEVGVLLEDGSGGLLLEDGGAIVLVEFSSIEGLLAGIDESVGVETPFFDAPIWARSRTTVVPIVQGYRVDLTLLLRREPRFAFVIETEAGSSLSAEDGRLLEVSV